MAVGGGTAKRKDLHIFLNHEMALVNMVQTLLTHKPGVRINAQELLCTFWMVR